jgi:NAD(P)-dependent dehydrogenase (short-subunit alcohol dehydrogenase family)
MSRFAGRNCYIVGGSSGIGLALAGELRACGAHILVLARNAERLAAAKADLEARAVRTGREGRGTTSAAALDTRTDADPAWVEVRVLDAADHAAAAEVLREAVESFGPPDLLVNSAGAARPARFSDKGPEDLEDAFRANVVTAWNPTRILLDHLRERGGTIMNVSSVAGLLGVYGLSDYCSSKFGVVGLSEALRQELAPEGVSVHVLCPPDTDTPGFERENQTKPVETRAVSGGVRVARPEEVARAALRGLRRGRFLIVPSAMAKFAHVVKVITPGLFNRTIDRIITASRRRAPRREEGIQP